MARLVAAGVVGSGATLALIMVLAGYPLSNGMAIGLSLALCGAVILFLTRRDDSGRP